MEDQKIIGILHNLAPLHPNKYIEDDLGAQIVGKSFHLLENSSVISRAVNRSVISEMEDSVNCETKLEREISNTEKKMKYCLEYLTDLCQSENNSEKLCFEKANVFLYFIETLALQGLGREKNQLTDYFGFFYDKYDCSKFAKARTALLKNPYKEISLSDIGKFMKNDVKTFFINLRAYLKEVCDNTSRDDYLKQLFILQDMLQNENVFDLKTQLEKLAASAQRHKELAECQIFSNEEVSSFMQRLQPSSSREQLLDEIISFLDVKISALKKEFESRKKIDAAEKKARSEEQKKVTPYKTSKKLESQIKVAAEGISSSRTKSSLDSFFNDDLGNLGNEIDDVKSFLKRQFEIVIKETYGEQKDLPAKLFNLAINFYPAIEAERGKDFKELLDFRNGIMHQFYKYGYAEFRRQMYKMRSILFRYYFAHEAGEVLKVMQPTDSFETISKNLQDKLDDFKKEFGKENEIRVISEVEATDYFGYEISQHCYPEIDDDVEPLVEQYLSFMAIIDNEDREHECLMDTDGEKSRNREPQYQEINDTERREIFENFVRLKLMKRCSSSLYDNEKCNFKKELVDRFGVNAMHFDNVCATHIENEQFTVEYNNEINAIVKVVKNLKKMKDHYKLSSQHFISLCDRVVKNQKKHDSNAITNLSSEVVSRIQQEFSSELKEESTILDIRVGDDLVRLKTRKVISNMLKVFYNSYHEYQAKFNIEEIFNDEVFLDYLTRSEKNKADCYCCFRICIMIKKLLQIEYTAPYVVRLITKNASDQVVEKNDFIRLLEILLKNLGGSYMKHLNVLLNEMASRNLKPYHEICEIIYFQEIDIESMSVVFSQPKHVKEILIVLNEKILQVAGSKENNVVKSTIRILKLLNNTSYELYKNRNCDDALEILEDFLDVYETLIGLSLVEKNETWYLMARYRKARIKNEQGKVKEEGSDKKTLHSEALDIFQSIRDLLGGDEISDSVTEVTDIETEKITIYLLALSDLAYTWHLLGKSRQSYKTYKILFREVVKFVCSVTGDPPRNISILEFCDGFYKSERYQRILAFSGESKKYLDILNIKSSVAYGKVCCGLKMVCGKKYLNASKLYINALTIYEQVHDCIKQVLGLPIKFETRASRNISYVCYKIGRLTSEIQTFTTLHCSRTALHWYYYTLKCNNYVYMKQCEMYWPSHPAVAQSRQNVINCLRNVAFMHNTTGSQNFYAKGKNYHRKALEIYERIYQVLSETAAENEHKVICNIKLDISYTKRKLRHSVTKIKASLQEVIDFQEDKLGEDHQITKKTKTILEKLTRN